MPEFYTKTSLESDLNIVKVPNFNDELQKARIYKSSKVKELEKNQFTKLDNRITSCARPVFPFTSIVGQEEMKLSLILNVIDPRIGGVMIMCNHGTGKNEKIYFEYKKIPLIDLPLGATEDRVCGTIDIEKALTEGLKSFEPGLLAQANRGFLYVDEVNLLDDHLVDVLLDSAASGWNTVEREGISIRHPARFVLMGSGNPEEGELRPQLLDRFGLHALIRTERCPELRAKIVEERAQFDKNPKKYVQENIKLLTKLKSEIVFAQELLPCVELNLDLQISISKVCSYLDVDGLQGDIVTNRAAKAYAAFEKRTKVTVEDVKKVIVICLRHRLRKDPLVSIDSGEKVMEAFYQVF